MPGKLPKTFNNVSGVYEVKHTDLCAFISKKYKIPNFHLEFSSCDVEEEPVFVVDSMPLPQCEKDNLEVAFKSSACNYILIGALLDDLCAHNIIPEGTYKIMICHHVPTTKLKKPTK
jgi:hypothetical protein